MRDNAIRVIGPVIKNKGLELTMLAQPPEVGTVAYRLESVMGIQSVDGSRSAPPSSGTVMQSQIRGVPRTTGKVSEYALSREAQALVLKQADSARAESRRASDALIDPNASKWRYSATLVK